MVGFIVQITTAADRTEKGVDELEKALGYQSKGGKWLKLCLAFLFLGLIFLVVYIFVIDKRSSTK